MVFRVLVYDDFLNQTAIPTWAFRQALSKITVYFIGDLFIGPRHDDAQKTIGIIAVVLYSKD
jgi:hypothetical protein